VKVAGRITVVMLVLRVQIVVKIIPHYIRVIAVKVVFTSGIIVGARPDRALDLKVIVSSQVLGKPQRLDPSTLSSKGVVHVNVEAMTDVKGLQVRAVVQDGCQSFIGKVITESYLLTEKLQRA
jgi:uncharacterized protein YebE (UPF0316 family)